MSVSGDMLHSTGTRKQKEDFCRMLSEKNSEKVAVYVALIASILALIITIFNYFAPSGTLFSGSAAAPSPARRSGGGPGGFGGPGGPGGRMMRGPSLTPEIQQKYEEQINLLDKICGLAEGEWKAGGAPIESFEQAQLERDKWRLNLLRLKNGRRASSSFADAYLALKCAESQVKDAEMRFKAGGDTIKAVMEAKARYNEAELRLMELERRLDPEKLAEAKAAVKSYPAKLTEEQLEKLLAAEPRSFGRR